MVEPIRESIEKQNELLEEILGKVVEYIKSGNHYSDGRYL